MDYFQINVGAPENQREIILAYLSQLPFDTFEETEEGLAAYIPEQDYSQAIEGELMDLQERFGFKWEKKSIPAQNWNARWEADFQPIIVGDFCGIRADFHAPLEQVRHEIVINPKMAFGTGHHETTYMVMESMENIPLSGKKVLDYGCGTGVLAILAAQCGAAAIDAIDYDILSYENTLENLKVNNIDNVVSYHGTLERLENESYDIILANINRNVILESLPSLYAMSKPGTLLVVSGFLLQDQELLIQSAEQQGFVIKQVKNRNKWLCINFLRNI